MGLFLCTPGARILKAKTRLVNHQMMFRAMSGTAVPGWIRHCRGAGVA